MQQQQQQYAPSMQQPQMQYAQQQQQPQQVNPSPPPNP
jgi:hypothetical protein